MVRPAEGKSLAQLPARLIPELFRRSHLPHKEDKLARFGEDLELFGDLFSDAVVGRHNAARQYLGDTVPAVKNRPGILSLGIVVGIAIDI